MAGGRAEGSSGDARGAIVDAGATVDAGMAATGAGGLAMTLTVPPVGGPLLPAVMPGGMSAFVRATVAAEDDAALLSDGAGPLGMTTVAALTTGSSLALSQPAVRVAMSTIPALARREEKGAGARRTVWDTMIPWRLGNAKGQAVCPRHVDCLACMVLGAPRFRSAYGPQSRSHERPEMSDPLHVVDATMFWSVTGGGVRRYLLSKHDWLARRPGWRHTIAVPGVDAQGGIVLLPSLPLPGSGGYRLPLRRAAIARVLEGLAPDLIEAGDPYRVAWGALDASRALDVPAVAYCHSNLELMARMAGGRRFGAAAARLARRYIRHVYAGFDLVLAPSLAMRNHLLDWGVARVACQPLGVDTTTFQPSRASADWRRDNGLAANARVLVYAGRFAPEKNLDVLADAVARLGPPYVLVAIGAGPSPPPSGPQVRVLPFVAGAHSLASALASADAFVHAGDQETFGLSALEALACGTPLVLRDAEGLAEMVDADTGIAVRRGDGAAFAEAIAALFERDRDAWRRAARKRALARDWEQLWPMLLDHYRRLLRRDAAAAAGVPFDSAAVPAER